MPKRYSIILCKSMIYMYVLKFSFWFSNVFISIAHVSDQHDFAAYFRAENGVSIAFVWPFLRVWRMADGASHIFVRIATPLIVCAASHRDMASDPVPGTPIRAFKDSRKNHFFNVDSALQHVFEPIFSHKTIRSHFFRKHIHIIFSKYKILFDRKNRLCNYSAILVRINVSSVCRGQDGSFTPYLFSSYNSGDRTFLSPFFLHVVCTFSYSVFPVHFVAFFFFVFYFF